MKAATTIHKEILKKDYAASPIGQLESKIGKIYEYFAKNKIRPPKDIVDRINAIRTKNEEDQMAYIEQSQRENREKVDELLSTAFTEELGVLETYVQSIPQI